LDVSRFAKVFLSPAFATPLDLCGLPPGSCLRIVRAKNTIAFVESCEPMKPAEGSAVIGKSITMRGEISGSEELYIDGNFEGTIRLPANRLTLGPNAIVKADLDAGDVVIYGKLEGNVRAAGRLELRDSAVLQGDIHAGRLSIEENASMKGKVELTTAQPATPAAASA